jgi:hypothetical protein
MSFRSALRRWLSGEPASRPRSLARTPLDEAPAADADRMAPEAALAPPDAVELYQRLTGERCDDGNDAPRQRHESAFLDWIHALLDSGQSLAHWVPRPPSMLPRLLACLRGEEPSLREASALVRGDPQLVADIVRRANSARMQHGTPVADLEQAVLRLGVDGLLRVAGASVMRPLYDARRDALLAQAAPKLARLALAKSLLCYMQAPRCGVDAFDAYLAGLTHNVGWVGVLRAVGVQAPQLQRPYSCGFIVELSRLSERVYGASAEQWQISDALTRLGSALRDSTLGESTLPLARVLWRAEAEVVRKLLPA